MPQKKGFTLIELLIVIAVMAILTTVVFVSLNPSARFQDARNNRRWQDVNAILQAIKLHQVDNNGIYLADINNMELDKNYQIGTAGSFMGCNDQCGTTGRTLEEGCVDLGGLTSGTISYLPSVPVDPSDSNASAAETRYYISKLSNGSLRVGSCSVEQGSASAPPTIEVTR
jgi:prepilin-type N-terminal cleavage/methylation domain-containing protein